MSVVIDQREKSEYLRDNADEVTLLYYDVEKGYSYDAMVHCVDGTLLRFERKTWPDFISSWLEGKLERQCASVDGLIVEYSGDTEIAGLFMEGGREAMELHRRARRHLANLSAQMWVYQSSGPEETMDIYRYIEKKGRRMEIRANRVKHEGLNIRQEVLSCLPGINPRRIVGPDGESLGEMLESIILWNDMEVVLNLQEWKKIKGIGPKTVEKIRGALVS